MRFLLLLAFAASVRAEPRLSPLGQPPDWTQLDAFQETITVAEFERLLREVYVPGGGWESWFQIEPAASRVLIRKTAPTPPADDDFYTLRCAPAAADAAKPPSRRWHSRDGNPVRRTCMFEQVLRPLAGVVIGLDPGHLGGRWAQQEERWFRIGQNTQPVTEGDMTLRVARLLADRLRALGAKPVFIRDHTEPQTLFPHQPPRLPRPADFLDLARTVLAARGITDPPRTYTDTADANRLNTLQWESLHLLLRADIFARAQRVNAVLHPDLVLCLHFNAEAWGDPKNPALVDKDHFHLLIHGCYAPDELLDDDTRLEMLVKLLNGSHAEELASAGPVADAVARATGLPPYEYTRPNALRVGPNPYVWARNLLANRLYQCPVLYLEPYVMNSPEVFARVQAGDYEGEREIAGRRRPSIYREYADAVAAGLAEYYRAR